MEARENGGWEAAQTDRHHAGRHDDGFTLAELMVSLAVLAVLSMIGVAAYRVATSHTVHGVTRTSVHGSHLDASTLLARDVTDATTITKADTSELVLNAVRNKVCETLDYKATTSLTLTTTFYQGTDCNGASQAKTQTLIPEITGATRFTYYSDVETVLTPPIDDLSGVKRIGWTLASEPAGFTDPITYTSAAAFTGHGDQTGSGTAAMQAKAAVLSVVTGTSEGRDAPVLSWVDPNPAGYVASWVLMRSANPEGMADTDPARTTWQQVGPAFPAGVTSFTDASLPAGYTAIYVVRPTLSDGTTAESSNPVITGLRPSAPTGLVVTGSAQSLSMTWTKAVGATGYDIYRDGALVAELGDDTSFTDGPSQYGWTANPADASNAGWGHSHSYTVTAQNRWESLLTTASQNLRAPLGDAVATMYRAGTVRLTSNVDGAFTAPAAPTLTVVANTSWNFQLAYTAAGWVGSGPTSKAGVGARDVSWSAQIDPGPGSAPAGSWSSQLTGRAAALASYTTSSLTEAQTASAWRWFRAATTNTVGTSPWGTPAGALQRPSAPASCTAATTGITTKQMAVTITPAAATIADVGYDVQGGVGADSGAPLGLGVQPGTSRIVDRLADGVTHTFATRALNASSANGGYSDVTSCSGATDALTASVPTWSSTTRRVTASFTAGLGTAQSIALSGSAMGGTAAGTSASWDLLYDGQGYTVTATNTDGDNTVTSSTTATTALLRQPTCSVSGGGTAPSGSIRVVASGSNGTPQVAAAGSGWYASGTSFTLTQPGTWTGTASATDGYNRSGSVNCGTVTVAVPAPAAPSCVADLSFTAFGGSGTAYANFCSSKYATSYQAQVQEQESTFGTWSGWSDIPATQIPQPPAGGDASAGIMRQLNAAIQVAGISELQIRVRAVNATGASGWTVQSLSMVAG